MKSGKIKVALVGIGSLAKALVEGVSYYTRNSEQTTGLMHPLVGNYRVKDIDFVCAFDVDERKVGKKLHEAINMSSNISQKITEPLEYSAMVYRGPTLDGVIDEMRGSFVHESETSAVDVAHVLQESGAEVVVNLLPTGSDKATLFYAEAALEAGCSFVNCIPTPLATTTLKEQFEKRGLVLLGDDIKSQLGATMLNRALLELLKMRGVSVTRSVQENSGGNTDHVNLLYRSKAKEKSKSDALAPFLDESGIRPTVQFFYTGKPSGHKVAKITLEGEIFGRMPILIVSTIEDEISVNGASTVVDAIRMAKFLVDTKKQKEAEKVCAFLMKSPPLQMPDLEGVKWFDKLATLRSF